MKVNVIFGSASDKPVYEPLCEQLRRASDVELYFQVCSAHREPARLSEIIGQMPCDIYVAGAGLAAHLPGVIASQTTTPVIGIPCSGVLAGLDSLLSILQMPKGVPVLTCGVDKVSSVINFISWYSSRRQRAPQLRIWGISPDDALAVKLRDPLEAARWPYCFGGDGSGMEDNCLNLSLPSLDGDGLISLSGPGGNADSQDAPSLGVPIVRSGPYTGNLSRLAEVAGAGGLWLGVNNLQNLHITLSRLWSSTSEGQSLGATIQAGGKQGAIA